MKIYFPSIDTTSKTKNIVAMLKIVVRNCCYVLLVVLHLGCASLWQQDYYKRSVYYSIYKPTDIGDIRQCLDERLVKQQDAWQDYITVKKLRKEADEIKGLLNSPDFYPITFNQPTNWGISPDNAIAHTQHWINVNACQLAMCGYTKNKIIRLYEKFGINIFRNTQYRLPGVYDDTLSAELLTPLIVLGKIDTLISTIEPHDGRRTTVRVKVREVLKGKIFSTTSTVEIRIFSGRNPDGSGVFSSLESGLPSGEALFYLSLEGYELLCLYPKARPYYPIHRESYIKPTLPLENQFYDMDYLTIKVEDDDKKRVEIIKKIELIKRVRSIIEQLE